MTVVIFSNIEHFTIYKDLSPSSLSLSPPFFDNSSMLYLSHELCGSGFIFKMSIMTCAPRMRRCLGEQVRH